MEWFHTTMDAAFLSDVGQIEQFRNWCREEAQEMFQSGKNRNQFMLDTTYRGTSPIHIGMALATKQLPSGNRDLGIAIAFTLLRRNSGWVGLDLTWQLCQGLDVHVIGAYGKTELLSENQPALILAVPPSWDNPLPGEKPTQITVGIPNIIREITKWHGARQCLWYPDTLS